MQTQKYSVNQHLIETLIAWIKSGEIAIPEIQRPFVWDSTKVRDLLDSLYKGFPIGYIITWKNPDVRLKDGQLSEGRKILIDGQQRITALRAAILGEYVVNSQYKKVRIKIAFNPLEERFEVQNPAILKDKNWIPDISEMLNASSGTYRVIQDYVSSHPGVDERRVADAIAELFNVPKKQIGLIELDAHLDIETVTEIFIRINSQGVVLSQADFAMSKIAADTIHGGQNMRKAIDYFCHLAVAPEFFEHIRDNDKEFAKSEFFRKMTWLRNEKEDLYDPNYRDLLRVVCGTEFYRGKLADLVSLLSGRNFETRTFEERISEESYIKLNEGIIRFMNETDFKRFIMILRSAGFIVPKMINSQNALNFAYLLYLTLRKQGLPADQIERYVKKWFIMTILTGRSSGSFESTFDSDIRQIKDRHIGEYLDEIEQAKLASGFWDVGLIQVLQTSSTSNPQFSVFLASQITSGDKGFLSRDISVSDLLSHKGDMHHLFPKKYLQNRGLSWYRYNQVANFVIMQQEINIRIGAKAPHEYFQEILDQVNNGTFNYGRIDNEQDLRENLRQHCIPDTIFEMDGDDYEDFLNQRRKLMAEKIKAYYYSL
jgi:hypothetical protein